MDYKDKKCPFKVEAALAAGKGYWEDIIKTDKFNCVGPECQAWTDRPTTHSNNCMRM